MTQFLTIVIILAVLFIPERADSQDKQVLVEFFTFPDSTEKSKEKIEKVNVEFSDSLPFNNQTSEPTLFILTKNDSIYGFTATYLNHRITIDLPSNFRSPIRITCREPVFEINFNEEGTSECYHIFLWSNKGRGRHSVGSEGETCQNSHAIQYVSGY